MRIEKQPINSDALIASARLEEASWWDHFIDAVNLGDCDPAVGDERIATLEKLANQKGEAERDKDT